MEIASLSEIKKELKSVSPTQLQEICIRLAKHRKENKELLSYLLFDSYNQQLFIENVKAEIDEQFVHLNQSSFYLAKKTLRKVLRTTRKYIRFSGSKQIEIELLIYFCHKLQSTGLHRRSSIVIRNMYNREVERILKVLASLHEDLQYDYREEVEKL